MKLLTIILGCSLFASCYTARVAKKDFGKAVTAYPGIAADYCAITFPIKERVLKGTEVVKFDTLYEGGETHYDTTYSFKRDTVYIVKLIPGKTIKETYYRVDTVYQQNTAAISALQLQLGDALELSVANAKSSNEWKVKSKRHFNWFLIACGMLGLGIVLRLKKVI